MNDLITVPELAAYLRVNVKTVYRLVEKGDIPTIRVGHLWRFSKEAIDAWLKQGKKMAKASILVIDNDENVGILFKEMLRETGYQVIMVQEPKKGLELIKDNQFDLVFLDLKMPEMDGIKVLKRIRALKPEMPVTIVTGFADSDLMMQALEYAPFGVMKKPFSSKDVMTAANNYLHLGRTGQ